MRNSSIEVSDPFGVASDPEMLTLASALNPVEAQTEFSRLKGLSAGVHRTVRLQEIRVTRYKPHRRCMIEYVIAFEGPDTAFETFTLIGKVRARRFGKSGYQLLSRIQQAGFGIDSEDGISVPEPQGTISKFQMWLQRKVPGQVATDLLSAPDGVELVRRIAEASHKLHQAGVPAERRHTMSDELEILRKCLLTVAREEPALAGRILRLLEACVRLGRATPAPTLCGIHRDFYADQLIVDGPRLYLIDFDLYCEGDAGLDVGNFVGHITEQSLRTFGDSRALADLERAMEERFVELAGAGTRAAVRSYAALTLARHIYLSTLFPTRRPFTRNLLELCEERLDIAGHPSARTPIPAAFSR